MTRSMNSRLDCPTCRCQMSCETAFERWMRENRLLDSRAGIVRFDLDVLLHRYMTVSDGFGDRTIQAIMFIEVKTQGASLSESQQDTLHVLNQVLRNRKKNVNGDRNLMNARDHIPIAKCYSPYLKRDIGLRMFGGHSLRFSGTCPEDSDWIRWGTPHGSFDISTDQLQKLIRFELDPDDPRVVMDIRRRSGPLPLIDFDGTASGD